MLIQIDVLIFQAIDFDWCNSKVKKSRIKFYGQTEKYITFFATVFTNIHYFAFIK